MKSLRQESTKSSNLPYWFTIGLISQLMTAPNISVMKVVLESMDPTTFNTLRAGIGALVAAPFVLWYWKKLRRTNVVYAVGAGLSTAAGVTLTTYAIVNSQASYVSVLSLISPIVLVVLSSYFFREKIRLRTAAGVTLGALGTLVAVAIPLVLGGQTTLAWYPLATSLIILASTFLPLATILLRKSNEAGLPLTSSQGISAAVVMAVSFAASFAIHGSPVSIAAVPANAWFGIAYSAIFVIFIARVLSTASYERVGSAVTSGLNYIGCLMALLIPIVFLHERLSWATLAGGIIILFGVYLTETNRLKKHGHFHLLVHHH